MLPTATARRYLVPTALWASRRCISAVAVVVVVAGAVGLGVITPAAATAALFLAVLLGGPEEPEGLSAHRLVVAGGGADLLFRGGIGSIPGEAVVTGTLRLLLEQEPEVFSFGLGLIVFRDGPEIELLCIPMQRSKRLVCRRQIVFRRRFPTLRNGVEGGGRKV